jgi:hypothetical protein
MRDDEFKKAMETWAESETESAPDLRPTAEMVRLVRAKQEPRRAFPISSRWAVAGAAIAGLLLVAALFALILRSGVIPGYVPTPEVTLIAQRVGPDVVQTTTVKGGGKGQGEKGPGPAPAAFRQLVFELQRQDSPAVQAIDLLNPPEELPILTPADNYRLVLEPVEERQVHVYQLTSSGSLVQIFPNPAYNPVPNPIGAGQLVTLPAEPNWLYLDGTPGEERLYVVASPLPLRELDDLYAQYSQSPDAASKDEILSEFLSTLDTVAETHPERASAVEFVFQHR